MALPTHEDILRKLSGQQKNTTPVVPVKTPTTFGSKISSAVIKTGNVVSEAIPGLRAVVDSIVQKTPAPAKEYLKNRYSGLTDLVTNPKKAFKESSLITGVNKDGTRVTKEQIIENSKNIVMATVGGEGASVIRRIAKEKSPQAIESILRGTQGIKDKTLKKISDRLAKTSDVKVVEKILREATNKVPSHADIISRIPRSETPQSGIRPQEIPQQIGQNKISELAPEGLKSPSLVQPAVRKVESYTQAYPEPSKLAIEAAVKQTGDNPETVRTVSNTLQKTKTDVVEYVQNSEERIRQLVSRPDVKVTEVSDPYLKATLYHGRVGARMETAKKEIEDIVLDLKTNGINKKDVSDYLVARHAPERNLELGDGAAGITTKAAQERLAGLEASAQGAKIKAIADKVQAINNKTLEMLQESGVITKELYSTLRQKYKSHVPLNRIMENSDDIGGALSGAGFDVKRTGIMGAKGSSREVADVLNNVVYNYEQALLRSEKNIVDNATLAFVKNNKDVLGDAFEIIRPKAIGKTFDDKVIMQQAPNDPTILQMFEDGKKVWLKIKDPQLALALRGVNRSKLGGLMNTIGAFTRFYAGLNTRFNPEFALPNKIRDLQEIAVYLASQKDVGFRGAFKTTIKDPQSMTDILSFLRGKDTPGARLYKEMKSLGGTTGGMGLSTKKQVELNMKKIESIANSKTKKLANNVIEYVDNWNTLFEDSTRLSVYRQAVESGLSKERAAFLAKEASINFNRLGKGGPVINALYMFSNASIQGSAKMLRAMKNPKVLGATMLTVGGAVAAVNEWNDAVDPNWRDAVTKWDRLNGLPLMLPSEDGGVHYVTIPVSWGLKPIKVMTDYAYDALSGQKFDAESMMKDTLGAVLEAYNPVGGTDLLSALTPTILDTPSEITRNLKWSGGKIRPDFDPNAPKDIQYFQSLRDTFSGRAAISITEMLQQKMNVAISPADIKYGYDQLIGGAGRLLNKVSDTTQTVAKGEVPPLDEFPMLSRFYRKRTAEEIGAGATTGESKDIKGKLGEQSRERFKVKSEAEQLYEEYKKLDPTEANKRAAELKKTNPAVYKKLAETFKDAKLGLTYTERLMKQLGVENGERAKYIYEQINKLPKDQRNAYYKTLKEKKIVSSSVEKQLKDLLKK